MAGGSMLPRRAIQAPIGAPAKQMPSTTWASEVNRLQYEYSTRKPSATGESIKQSGLSW